MLGERVTVTGPDRPGQHPAGVNSGQVGVGAAGHEVTP